MLQWPLTASSLPGFHSGSACQPVGRDAPTEVAHPISGISDIHVTIRSSGKVSVMKS